MPSVFLVSDTHFGHTGVCRFTRNDGVTKLRPWDDADEMDEAMVKAWNERVKPTDKVYHLGDVVINRKSLKILSRLNGDKVLIRGNHDIFRDDEYRLYFRELRAYHVMNGMILSHIPLHSDSMGRFGVNIHGHLHANRVKKARGVDAKTGEVVIKLGDKINFLNAKKLANDGLKDILVSRESMFGKILHRDVKVNDEEEGIFAIGTELNDAIIQQILDANIHSLQISVTNSINKGPYLLTTILNDKNNSKEKLKRNFLKSLIRNDKIIKVSLSNTAYTTYEVIKNPYE